MVKNNGLCALRPPVFVKQFNAVTGFHGLHILVSIVGWTLCVCR
jgi:heme/copper-type cytochrome/quinol oxidase subunit 3